MNEKEKRRILIVDDDAQMLEIYKSMFEDKQDAYDFVLDNDAREAFTKLREEAFDLVILDMIMEPMEGEMFFACVRSAKELPETPILVVSVLDPEGLKHMKRINHVTFLQKPISEEQLFEKIDQILA